MQGDKLKNAVPEGFEDVELKSMPDNIKMDFDIALSEGVKKGEKFDLWYRMFFALDKAAALTVIRSITGMGLGELNEKVHYPPLLLKEGLSITELNQLLARYDGYGIRYSFKE